MDKIDYYMGLCFAIAEKSPDPNTKHGCLLVNDEGRIISQGWNGFPSKAKDRIMPRHSPEKYKWIIHAEANAVYNSIHSPKGATCYVSGMPCPECLKMLYQNSIRKIFYGPLGHTGIEESKAYARKFIFYTNNILEITEVIPDLSWLQTLVDRLKEKDFL